MRDEACFGLGSMPKDLMIKGVGDKPLLKRLNHHFWRRGEIGRQGFRMRVF